MFALVQPALKFGGINPDRLRFCRSETIAGIAGDNITGGSMGRTTGFEDGPQSINRAAEGFGGVLAPLRPERFNNPFGGHGSASLSQQQLQELASLAGMPF